MVLCGLDYLSIFLNIKTGSEEVNLCIIES
jgi:hypothetical protein